MAEGDGRRKPEGALTNRLLILCFAIALAINVGYTLVGLASLPTYYERVTTQTVEPYVVADQTVVSNELVEREAAVRGMSLSAYAVYQVVLNCVLALVPLAVAAVVAWHAGSGSRGTQPSLLCSWENMRLQSRCMSRG